MRKSGRLHINGNASKRNLQCDRSTGTYVFRNGYPFTRIYPQAKLRAATYKQELRTYVHDRRYSNNCRGIRSPSWPAVLYPDNPLDSFVDMSLSTWLVHKLGHKFTCMYLPTFALRTTSAFPGLALCTTMAYWYLRTYLSTLPLRTTLTLSRVSGSLPAKRAVSRETPRINPRFRKAPTRIQQGVKITNSLTSVFVIGRSPTT